METWEWTIARDYRDRIAGILYFLYIIFSLCISILFFFFEHSLRDNFHKKAFSFANFCLHFSGHFSRFFPSFHLFYLFPATDTAAYLLEKALQVDNVNPFPLIEAVYWLESAYVIEQLNATQLRAIRANHKATTDGDSYSGSGNDGDSSESVVKRVSNRVKKMIANTLSEEGDVEGSGTVHTPAHLLKNTGIGSELVL